MSDTRDYTKFSSDDLPERKRVELWREQFGHIFLKADIEPAENTPFRVDLTARTLPGLRFISTVFSPVRICRTRKFVADGNDNFIFLMNMN